MKRRTFRRPAARCLAILLATAVFASACGSDGDDDEAAANASFSKAYEQVTQSFEDKTQEIRAEGEVALRAGDDGAVLDVYRELLDATRDAHQAYSDVRPAADVRLAFGALVEQLAAQVEILGAVVTAAESSDDAALATELQRLAVIVVEVTNARRVVDRQVDAMSVASEG